MFYKNIILLQNFAGKWEFEKNWNNCEGRFRKIKIYREKIQKIVFNEFGKMYAKLDESFNTNLPRNVRKVEIKLERNF